MDLFHKWTMMSIVGLPRRSKLYFLVPLVVLHAYTISAFTSIRLIQSTRKPVNFPLFSSSITMDNKSVRDALLNCPKIPLRNGIQHPVIGFGTYKVGFLPLSASEAVATPSSTTGSERTAVESIQDALATGYRFLECAEFYGNEMAVGEAIEKSGVSRKDLFLCSKVWTTNIEKGDAAIRAQLDQTLKDLRTDYLDLYLVHWPVPGHHVAAYKTLLSLQKEGKVRGVGVSNYAWEDYLELKNDPEISEADLPLVNQIEINPFLYRSNTISKFEKEGVVLQSYRSLRNGKAMQDETLVRLATKYSKTSPAPILARWCIQHGFVTMPKSVKTERMVENAAVFDFEISKDDMKTLDALTTPAALDDFQELYRKCVNRDTTKAGTMDGVKMDITID